MVLWKRCILDDNCSEGMPRPARRDEKIGSIKTVEAVEEKDVCKRKKRR